MEELNDAYYIPNNLWKDSRTIGKLHKITEIPRKKVKEWLAKQALWEVHIPGPKQYIHRAHFTVPIPNQQHQFDVAYMPQ